MTTQTIQEQNQTLFPTQLPPLEWTEFSAAGFSAPVSGMVYRSTSPAACGMPLGGIDTGCIDLETNGTFGYSSLFNSLFPRREPARGPFLGLALGDKAWTLSTIRWPGVDCARDLHYWGHYPIADLEYELDARISVGMRAWTPFIPGDVAASNTPAAVFEVQLRNTGNGELKGSLAFSFPGPLLNEAGTGSFGRQELQIGPGAFHGVLVAAFRRGRRPGPLVIKGPPAHAPQPYDPAAVLGVIDQGPSRGGYTCDCNAAYVLGVIGQESVRLGGELGNQGSSWANLTSELPATDPIAAGASVAVDFCLEPGETKTVRFILAWHSPVWRGHGSGLSMGNAYTHMYASRFPHVIDVVQFLLNRHESLLDRVLAWQRVIYQEQSLPGWLKDSLINNLHLITECGVWAQAKPPIGDWCRPEDGLFGMNESPRLCPQIECIPCSFYGNLPLVYFFPELALSTLRGYKAYMYPDGAVPWVFGGFTGNSGPYDMATPTRGYQTTTNGPCFVDLVHRYWMRTGNQEFLREFYPYVKKNTAFTMDTNRGPDGVISMPDRKVSAVGDEETEWFESCEWGGMTSHVGGVHLANLRMAQHMAQAVGDQDFVKQCQDWLDQGTGSMEEKMWNGEYYLNYWDVAKGQKSDLVMAYQLDGEWMVRFHGLEQVFRPERVRSVLATVKRTNIPLTPYGAVNFAQADGSAPPNTVGYGSFGIFVAEVFMLSMTYMYAGQREFGLELTRRCVANIVCRQRLAWDFPCLLNGDSGTLYNGNDYYQGMMLWSLPAALSGQDLNGPCEPGGLVDRIVAAAREDGAN